MNVLTTTTSSDPDSLFARARAGDNTAWDQLFQECYPKLRRAVRRRLAPQMKSILDSTDLASDVMKSLMANANRLDFNSFESLLNFLIQVAEQKVIDEHRKAHTLKRDITRQRAFATDHGDECRALAVASSDPTASQVVLATEFHERLVADLKEPEQKIAIGLKAQGYTLPEIAKEIGWHLRKVQRFFQTLEQSFAQGN